MSRDPELLKHPRGPVLWIMAFGIGAPLIFGSLIGLWLTIDGFLWPHRTAPSNLQISRVIVSKNQFPFGGSCAWYLLSENTISAIQLRGLEALSASASETYHWMSEWRETPAQSDGVLFGEGDSAYGSRYLCGQEFASEVRHAINQRGNFYAVAPFRGNTEAIYIIIPATGRMAFLGYD